MKQNEEIETVCRLSGADPDRINFSDDGFLSRAYLVDEGKYIFKFAKYPEVEYQTEEKMLKFIANLDLPVKTQKVAWTSPEGTYIGLEGVQGQNLDHVPLNYQEKIAIGEQLGRFLKILHRTSCDSAMIYPPKEEIQTWQERYRNGIPVLNYYFSPSELQLIDELMMQEMPAQLNALGEKMVFSHGDLGDGNVLVDEGRNVGVIDFSEMIFLDEAADFMDISDETISQAMLDSYGAGGSLRRKVQIRRLIRPIFVIATYAYDGRKEGTERLVQRIRETVLA